MTRSPLSLALCLFSISSLGIGQEDHKRETDTIQRLMEQLRSDSFQERVDAAARLIEIGEKAVNPLRAALKKSKDPDFRVTSKHILSEIEHPSPSTYRLWKTIPAHCTGPMAWSPDARLLLIPKKYSVIDVVEVASGKTIHTLRGVSKKGLNCAAFRPDGAVLAVGGFDSVIQIIDAKTWKQVRTLSVEDDPVSQLVWSPNGKLLASEQSYHYRFWNPSSGKEILRFGSFRDSYYQAMWNQDGTEFITAGPHLEVWNPKNGTRLLRIGHKGHYLRMAILPELQRYATSQTNGSITFWEIDGGKQVKQLTLPQIGRGRIVAFAAIQKGRYLLATADETIRFIDTETGKIVGTLEHHSAQVTQLVPATQGRMFASAGRDYQVKIWRVRPSTPRTGPKGFFGVRFHKPPRFRSHLQKQCFIETVFAGSGAEAARIQPGDILRRIGEKRVSTTAEAIGIMGTYKKGDRVPLILDRNGKEIKVTLEVGPMKKGDPPIGFPWQIVG